VSGKMNTVVWHPSNAGCLRSALPVSPKDVGTDPVRASVRFPLHLDIVLSTAEREYKAVTEDVSANGICFIAEDLPPVDSQVEFRMKMPAAIMGGSEDVTLHCVGRIVRHELTAGKNMAAAVIDDYSLKG
jgi:hypothetical protein